MKKIMNYTSWGMKILEAYGFKYCLFFVLGLLIVFFLAYKLKTNNEPKRNKVLFICGLILLFMEIYKILFYIYVIDEKALLVSIIPFQLCSIPIYFCLALPFVKKEKVYIVMCNFLMTYNLLGGLISFFMPSALIRGFVMLTIHTFTWHFLMIFIGLFLFFSNVKIKIKDFKYCFLLFLIFCFIALGINFLLDTHSQGNINLFYVGPQIPNIFLFSDIAIKYGWHINLPIYIVSVSLSAFGICSLFSFINKKYRSGNIALKKNI